MLHIWYHELVNERYNTGLVLAGLAPYQSQIIVPNPVSAIQSTKWIYKSHKAKYIKYSF